MGSTEIFPNSLVKRVYFQIRFPNLFYLADRIGDFQTKIMKQFPKSKLLMRRRLVIASQLDKQKYDELLDNAPDDSTDPLWVFESEQGVKLEISSDSLVLVSENHKSYGLGEEPFRDVIESTTNHFFDSTNVPVLKRVGLRYIDEGPVPENRSELFREYYNTAFPLQRFPMEKASEMNYMAVVDRGRHKLRYVESLQGDVTNRKLVLDWDSWSEDVEPNNLLEVTDELHEILWDAFAETVKEPVWKFMRKPVEDNDVSE